jgi:hypothetical protein
MQSTDHRQVWQKEEIPARPQHEASFQQRGDILQVSKVRYLQPLSKYHHFQALNRINIRIADICNNPRSVNAKGSVKSLIFKGFEGLGGYCPMRYEKCILCRHCYQEIKIQDMIYVKRNARRTHYYHENCARSVNMI